STRTIKVARRAGRAQSSALTQGYARDARGRSPIFWILLMLVIGGVGLALDKGFTDNTPPYDEPAISSVGLLLFLLCGCAFVVLCTVALVRLLRGSASVAVTP